MLSCALLYSMYRIVAQFATESPMEENGASGRLLRKWCRYESNPDNGQLADALASVP